MSPWQSVTYRFDGERVRHRVNSGPWLPTVIPLALAACAPPPPVVQSAENVAAVAQYEALLEDCRKEGRRTRSYEAYERCAAEVDRHLCEQHRVMCPDGGR